MRAADGSRSPPPPLALPPRADRFQLWKLQRDRERRQERLGMPASPQSPRSASRGSAEEWRHARRVSAHSQEEDELMDMVMERERQESESEASKRLRRLQQQQQQQQQRNRQLPPLSASSLARSRRFTVPTQKAEQQREDKPAPRRSFGSAPRVQGSLFDNEADTDGNTVGTIPISEVADRYSFQPASSLRWRSMKPSVDDVEQRKREEEADADRLLELAAMDSGKRKDLWDNFYINSKTPHANVDQHQKLVSPVIFATNTFTRGSVLQSQSGAGSWGRVDLLQSESARAREKTEASEQHSSTQSSDAFDHSSLNSRLVGLRRRLRKSSESAVSGASEAERSERTLHEELAGMDQRMSERPKQDDVDATSTSMVSLFDAKRAFDETFPPWSVVFLASCVAAGLGGFFVEEVMEVVGFFFKTMPFSVSRAEQQRLHERLEGLQKELRGFRSAASEIDSHSQKVFDEVRRHLDKLRSEREKHQDMVAKEMRDLRRYVLQMTYEMVEQERQVIHQRLKETVGVQVAGEVVSPPSSQADKPVDREDSFVAGNAKQLDSALDNAADARVLDASSAVTKPQREDADAGRIQPARTVEVATSDRTHAAAVDRQDVSKADRVRVDAVIATIDQIVNDINLSADLPASVPSPHSADTKTAPRLPLRGVFFMSWQATLVLVLMVFVGGYVGLRLRSISRRKRWLEDRRRRRQQQSRHRFFSPSRPSERVADSEQDGDEQGEDEWEDAGSEHSIETVALMTTPVNSGGEEDDCDFEEQSELASSMGSVSRSEYESEVDKRQEDGYIGEAEAEDNQAELESDGQEESKGEEQQYLSDEWDEMDRAGDDVQDDLPEFVHPSTEYEQEDEPAPVSAQAAVYRMATTEVSGLAAAPTLSVWSASGAGDASRSAASNGQHRFPLVAAQARDSDRKSARMERRKFARQYL